MKEKSISDGFILRLDKGEELVSSLSGFCSKKNIGFASVNGIGAASKVKLSVFDTETKEYLEKEFEGDLELISLMGNISIADGKPKVHVHGCISGHDFLAHSGHVVSAVISVTCELVLFVPGEKIERKLDEETGLQLLSL